MATPETVVQPRKPVTKAKQVEPREYIFRLTDKHKHEQMFDGSSPFTARLICKTEDDILWAYKDGKPVGINDDFDPNEVSYEVRKIRYVNGINTIFVDEQEEGNRRFERDAKGDNRLLDNPANHDKITFERGEIKVPNFDKARKDYLQCMSQCQNQNPRAKQFKPAVAEYKMLDFAQQDASKIQGGITKEKAYDVARTARLEEMMPHAKFLNIPFTHDQTDVPRSEEAIREDYKDFAYTKTKLFMDSFGDPTVKIIYQINQLRERGEIAIHDIVQGQAHWIKTGSPITNLPPDKEPVQFLADFALTEAGTDFANRLKSFK